MQLGFYFCVYWFPCSLGSRSSRRRIPVSFLPKETQQLEQLHRGAQELICLESIKNNCETCKGTECKVLRPTGVREFGPRAARH